MLSASASNTHNAPNALNTFVILKSPSFQDMIKVVKFVENKPAGDILSDANKCLGSPPENYEIVVYGKYSEKDNGYIDAITSSFLTNDIGNDFYSIESVDFDKLVEILNKIFVENIEEMLVTSVSPNDTSHVEEKGKSKTKKSSMRDCFKNGDKIRHKRCKNGVFFGGSYDYNENVIKTTDGKKFKSLSALGAEYYKINRLDRTTSCNGWVECKVKRDGKWVSCDSLRQ